MNHNGSIQTALELVDEAATAGADAVKFQTFIAEELATCSAPKAEYQRRTTCKAESQLEMLKKLELDREAHLVLMDRCVKNNIKFLSSPFDFKSIELLENLGLDTFKIPSGELTNLPYLRKIGRLGKKVILSTGMACLGEIEAALDVLTSEGTPKSFITVLHCNTEYPTPFEDVNLRAMLTIRDAFGVDVGYSDHTTGIEAVIAAVAFGASIVEKHFTIDRAMEGPDHKASLEPSELGAMVKAVRNIEKAMGSGVKTPSSSERKNISVARKRIVVSKFIKAGELFADDNLTVKRSAVGLSPMLWDFVIGQQALKDYEKDEAVHIPDRTKCEK